MPLAALAFSSVSQCCGSHKHVRRRVSRGSASRFGSGQRQAALLPQRAGGPREAHLQIRRQARVRIRAPADVREERAVGRRDHAAARHHRRHGRHVLGAAARVAALARHRVRLQGHPDQPLPAIHQGAARGRQRRPSGAPRSPPPSSSTASPGRASPSSAPTPKARRRTPSSSPRSSSSSRCACCSPRRSCRSSMPAPCR